MYPFPRVFKYSKVRITTFYFDRKFQHLLILVVAMVLGMIPASLHAATARVSSLSMSSTFELQSFVAGGKTFTQADLIVPSITSLLFNGGIAATEGAGVPAAGKRSLLMTDFQLDTGLLNVIDAHIQFTPGLVNGPGPDLVLFSTNYYSAENFEVETNGVTVAYPGTLYDLKLGEVPYHYYSRGSNITLSVLDSDPFPYNPATAGNSGDTLCGIVIDLDDFAVGPLARVTEINFPKPIPNGDRIEVFLLAGIRSAVVPEPSTLLLTALALVPFFGRRRRARSHTCLDTCRSRLATSAIALLVMLLGLVSATRALAAAPRKIVTPGENVSAPINISSDGSRVSYVSDGVFNSSVDNFIYSVSLDGGAAASLTPQIDSTAKLDPTINFLVHRDQVFYTVQSPANVAGLYAASIDGDSVLRLRDGYDSFYSAFHVSPDGNRVVFRGADGTFSVSTRKRPDSYAYTGHCSVRWIHRR